MNHRIIMSIFKVFTLCVLICATLAAEQDGSSSANQNIQDDNTVMIPEQVLRQLTDIGHRSKGLFKLWGNAFHQIDDDLLKNKVTVTSVHVHMQ